MNTFNAVVKLFAVISLVYIQSITCMQVRLSVAGAIIYMASYRQYLYLLLNSFLYVRSLVLLGRLYIEMTCYLFIHSV